MAKFKTASKEEGYVHDPLKAPKVHYKAGDTIFAEGEIGLCMYLIQEGEVEIRKKFGDKEKVLAVLGKGDFFGEMSLLMDDLLRTATAVAKTDVEALVIGEATFRALIERNAELSVRIMRKLIKRLHDTTMMLEEALGGKRAEQKEEEKEPEYDQAVSLVELKSGMRFPLRADRVTTIGRMDAATGIHPDIDLTPVDQRRSVSRRHAVIKKTDEGYVIVEDVGTMNGTFVNGVRVQPGEPHPINSGDIIKFGTVECRFEIAE